MDQSWYEVTMSISKHQYEVILLALEEHPSREAQDVLTALCLADITYIDGDDARETE